MLTHTRPATGGNQRLSAPHNAHYLEPQARARATATPRLIARGLAALLWGIGSAYLVHAELQNPAPNPIVMAATPALWAAVIAIPVLAGHALAERQRLAALLLTAAALLGSVYMLTGTLGRQSETRDAKLADAREADAARARIKAQLDDVERILASSRASHAKECSTGAGRNCTGIATVITLSESAAAKHREDLGKLKASAPDAGEKRLARLLALLTGRTVAEMADLVADVLPALFGLVIELAALACAKYGWAADRSRTVKQSLTVAAPSDLAGQSDYPAISATEAAAVSAFMRPDERSGPSGGKSGGLSGGSARPPKGPAPLPASERRDEVLAALLTDLALGRSAASQRDLCGRFGVPRSTMSDWLGEWERSGLIPARRTVGRCKALEA